MAENRVNKSNKTTGIILILVGIVLLLAQFGRFRWENLWPLFLIVGGGFFFLGFFSNRENYGLLMPASVLTVIGLFFLYSNSGRWDQMEVLWPTFVLAPGIGFVLMYIFAPKGNSFWIPASILLIIALVFYARFWLLLRYWPVILIVLGVYLLIKAGRRVTDQDPQDPVDFTKT